MQSSTTVAFRAVVMLFCLIAIPVAALFGTSLPDLFDQLLERRGDLIAWLDRGSPVGAPPFGSTAHAAPSSSRFTGGPTPDERVRRFQDPTVCPKGLPGPGGSSCSLSCPSWNHAGSDGTAEGRSGPFSFPGGPGNALRQNSRTLGEPPTVAATAAWSEEPTVQLGRGGRSRNSRAVAGETGVTRGSTALELAAAELAAVTGAGGAEWTVPVGGRGPSPLRGSDPTARPPRSGAAADRFASIQQRLRELGSTYYLLETWGSRGDYYRFHTRIAIGGNPDYARHFEATDAEALGAMAKVLEQVEAWRSGDGPL